MSLFKCFGRRLAAVSAITASACAAAPAAEPTAVRPAIWQVADEDTTIYLFGTIHLLPKDTKWRSPAFDKVAEGADTLVVETVVDEGNPVATLAELFRLGVRPGLPPILERVPADKRTVLEAAIAKTSIPAQEYDRMETWTAAFLLLSVQFQELGLDSGSGVEAALKTQFTKGGKPIGQLETNAEQFSFFDGLSENSQRDFLVGVIEDPRAMKSEFDGMLAAWSRGDVKAIASSFNRGLSGAPELENALLIRRNFNWAQWVKRRLDQPGTVLVAVGAGHLAGKHSVLAQLKDKGLKVKRVQ
jgi:hypothetical protein